MSKLKSKNINNIIAYPVWELSNCKTSKRLSVNGNLCINYMRFAHGIKSLLIFKNPRTALPVLLI